ncbi:MAG: hypothetical protein IGQ45_07105 [Cyanobacterium sp. T60_A2020_053]|nr:hypothetical protein [Cyanobacterium sp. T60_A2020_053]
MTMPSDEKGQENDLFSASDEVKKEHNLLPAKSISPSSLRQISPNTLAYIGDAVYELHIRTHYLLPCLKIADHHRRVVEQVRAETQARYLNQIMIQLTPEEKDWVRRGRNSVNKSPRRLSLTVYQQATGLETLLGYLYITDGARLTHILQQLDLK